LLKLGSVIGTCDGGGGGTRSPPVC
jgi:hypothetical protein